MTDPQFDPQCDPVCGPQCDLQFKILYCIGDEDAPIPDCTPAQNADPGTTLLVTDDRTCAAVFKQKGGCVIGLIGDEDIHTLTFPEADALCTAPEDLTDAFARRTFCHFHKIPFTVAQTQRLIVRESIPQDYEAIHQILLTCDNTTFEEDYDRSQIESQEGFLSYISTIYRFLGFGTWTVLLRETQDIVGWCGLNLYKSADASSNADDTSAKYVLDLGYLIGQQFRGQGYAKEACEAILTYSFDELGADRIIIRTVKDNQAAIHVAHSLGFSLLAEQNNTLTFELRAPHAD